MHNFTKIKNLAIATSAVGIGGTAHAQLSTTASATNNWEVWVDGASMSSSISFLNYPEQFFTYGGFTPPSYIENSSTGALSSTSPTSIAGYNDALSYVYTAGTDPSAYCSATSSESVQITNLDPMNGMLLDVQSNVFVTGTTQGNTWGVSGFSEQPIGAQYEIGLFQLDPYGGNGPIFNMYQWDVQFAVPAESSVDLTFFSGTSAAMPTPSSGISLVAGLTVVGLLSRRHSTP